MSLSRGEIESDGKLEKLLMNSSDNNSDSDDSDGNDSDEEGDAEDEEYDSNDSNLVKDMFEKNINNKNAYDSETG